MAKNPFDSFSKQLLEELLSPYGAVEVSREVPGESQFVYVYFETSPQTADALAEPGLLSRIAQTACLLEPLLNQPSPSEVRSCLVKLFKVHGYCQRKALQEKESLQDDELPYLWILTLSVPDTLLNGFGFARNSDWPSGVYFMPPVFKTAMIVIDQLPCTEASTFLRLLERPDLEAIPRVGYWV